MSFSAAVNRNGDDRSAGKRGVVAIETIKPIGK
jgi:hypothetical protein